MPRRHHARWPYSARGGAARPKVAARQSAQASPPSRTTCRPGLALSDASATPQQLPPRARYSTPGSPDFPSPRRAPCWTTPGRNRPPAPHRLLPCTPTSSSSSRSAHTPFPSRRTGHTRSRKLSPASSSHRLSAMPPAEPSTGPAPPVQHAASSFPVGSYA